MITASLVLYKSKNSEVERVLGCVERSAISIVYVVDNSPTDDLRIEVEKSTNKAVYIFGQGNVGYGEGNNIGIKKAIEEGSKYHVILNPDIIFETSVIVNLSVYMDNHEDVGLVKPALTHLDGSFNSSAYLLPTPLDVIGRRLLFSKISEAINKRYELRDKDLTVARNVPNFSGSFLFIRTSIFEKVGLFDNRYFMYFEDYDLVRRIHKVSKTVFYPHETIIHAHAAEHRTNKKLLKISIKSAIKYFNKFGWFFDSERRKWNKEAQSDSSILE